MHARDVGGQPLRDAGVAERDDARREERRVDRAADRHRRNRNAGRHLHDREQRVEPAHARDCTGTPMTGTRVFAAVMPGKCAAPPAPAMIAASPRLAADAAYSNISSGMRCAETTRTSHGISSSSSVSRALDIVSQSDRLPMMIPTIGALLACAIARLRPFAVVIPEAESRTRSRRACRAFSSASTTGRVAARCTCGSDSIIDEIAEDMARIKALGLDVVRFFLMWEAFQPRAERDGR